MNEVEDELGEAIDNGYVTGEEIGVALNLKKRAYVATSRFRNSIKDRPDPPWNRWPKQRPKRRKRTYAPNLNGAVAPSTSAQRPAR